VFCFKDRDILSEVRVNPYIDEEIDENQISQSHARKERLSESTQLFVEVTVIYCYMLS